MIKILEQRDRMIAPVQTIGRTTGEGATSSFGVCHRIAPHHCQRVVETTDMLRSVR